MKDVSRKGAKTRRKTAKIGIATQFRLCQRDFALVIRVVFQRVLLGVRRLLVASVGFLGGVRRRILA